MNCKICKAQYREGEECPNLVNHEILPEDENPKNYSEMKRNKLVALAQEKEIDLTGDENRAELIELLEAKENI